MLSAAVDNIRAMERLSIDSGTPEYQLMLRAGVGAAAWISKHFGSRASRLVVLAGGGNNGGDALVAAAELSKKFPVQIYSTCELSGYRNCAANAAADLPSHIPFEFREKLDVYDFRSGDVIVDGDKTFTFDSMYLLQYAPKDALSCPKSVFCIFSDIIINASRSSGSWSKYAVYRLPL